MGYLTPYFPTVAKPWNTDRVRHVYRRLGFGANMSQIEAGLRMRPDQLIDSILNSSAKTPVDAEPVWLYWKDEQYGSDEEKFKTYVNWLSKVLQVMGIVGFRDKLALFWSNHFVTEYEAYFCPAPAYIYWTLMQKYSLGNFKEFVKEVGKTPAMLFYLNGLENVKQSPNENYARELYELFTLGRDNGYTQQDIIETAKALTGWKTQDYRSCVTKGFFEVILWDSSIKTIFGKTGRWGYDEVHEILFKERSNEIAEYICGKLYKFFVAQNPPEAVIAEMGQAFIQSNFEIAAPLRLLFKSEHFFDEAVMGIQIKSPIELMLGFVNEWEVSWNIENILDYLIWLPAAVGQYLLSPVDVAGWPGHRTWINTDKLTGRWRLAEFFMWNSASANPKRFAEMAKRLTNNSKDPAFITKTLVNYFTPLGLQKQEYYDRLTTRFKGAIPQNYYDDGSWNLDWDSAPWQTADLLYQIFRLPEFQLT